MKKLDAKKEKNGFFAHPLPITFSSLKKLIPHNLSRAFNDKRVKWHSKGLVCLQPENMPRYELVCNVCKKVFE